jgi:hypothetical protein
VVNDFKALEYLLLIPTDWNEEAKPCSKCKLKNTKERA